MQAPELFEEIRALLRQPQAALVEVPFQYPQEDIVVQVRGALRALKARGVTITQTMDASGALSDDLDDTHGALLALLVASRLLAADMLQKLQAGEMGVIFRTGSDLVDTSKVADAFKSQAHVYDFEFAQLLTIVLAGQDQGTDSFFGDQTPFAG